MPKPHFDCNIQWPQDPDALPFGRLRYGEPNAISNAIESANVRSRSHDAVIRVYDEAGNVIGTHKQAGEFKKPQVFTRMTSQFPLRGISHDSAFVGLLPRKQPD
jgi:hypothetical protein